MTKPIAHNISQSSLPKPPVYATSNKDPNHGADMLLLMMFLQHMMDARENGTDFPFVEAQRIYSFDDQSAFDLWLSEIGNDFARGLETLHNRDIDFGHLKTTTQHYPHLSKLPDYALTDDPDFNEAIRLTLQFEGGYNPKEVDGYVGHMGLNSKYHPEVTDGSFSFSRGVEIYKQEYWDTIKGIDDLPPHIKLIAFDAAVNCGAGRAKAWLKECLADDGRVDIDEFNDKRLAHYTRLIDKNSDKYGQYEKGWGNRVKELHARAQEIEAEQDHTQKHTQHSETTRGFNQAAGAMSLDTPQEMQAPRPSLTPSMP